MKAKLNLPNQRVPSGPSVGLTGAYGSTTHIAVPQGKPLKSGDLTVVLVIGAAVGVVYIARLKSKPGDFLTKPGQMVRIGFGGTICIVALLVMARADASLAKAFAWLILAGTLLTYGSVLFGDKGVINTALNAQVTKKAGK